MGRTRQEKAVSASQPVTEEELEDVEIETKVLSRSPTKKDASSSSSQTSGTPTKSKNKTIPGSKGKGPNEIPTENDEITEKDLERGMSLLVTMSDVDFHTFLDRIDAQSPNSDKIKVRARNGKLDWNNIAFGVYGPKKCRLMWEFLLSNARRYRIMSEVVQEFRHAVERNPRYIKTLSNCPQPPPETRGGYQVYVRELWKTHQEDCEKKGTKHMNWCQFYKGSQDGYQKLTERDKGYYEKLSKKRNDEYQAQLQAYYKEHPHLLKAANEKVPTVNKTPVPKAKKRKPTTASSFPDAPIEPVPPYAYFIQSKLKKLETPPSAEELPPLKAKYAEKYKKLSEKKKAKWIDYTINYCQNYQQEIGAFQAVHPSYCPRELKIKSVIKKSDIAIWEKYRGKPKHPKNNVFDLFFEDFCNSEENAHIPLEDRRREAEGAFKELDWYRRSMYKMNFKMNSMKYKKDIAIYFETVPDVVKDLVTETIPRKHRSSLLDVGMYPVVSDVTEDENADKEEFGDATEEELPSPKKKKNKKRKHGDNEESSETDGLTTSSKKNNVGNESEEIASDASASKRKKKKKKDRNSEEELITGDVVVDDEDDDPSIKIENSIPVENPKPPLSPRRILQKLKPQSPVKPILSNSTVPPRPPASNFVANKIGQQDIDDALRGIFDGRSHYGRKFSAYYYYAKYVCQHKHWLRHTDFFGVMETADRIVASFLELSDKQKDIFIAQSYNFYLQKRYGITVKGNKTTYEPEGPMEFFPGEPRPPTRSAAVLYNKEVEYLTRKNVSVDFPKWDDLHVDTQMIFVKKLYREAQLYMKRYEEFVVNMSPNDMIEYVISRARYWEHRFLKETTVVAAAKGFVFPLPRNESADGYHSGPEIVDDMPGTISGRELYAQQKVQQKQNPFAFTRPKYTRYTKIPKQVQVTERAETGENEDADDESCVSSDDEVRLPYHTFKKDQPHLKPLNDVKDYFFPMGVLTRKMLSPTKIRKKVSKLELERMKKAREALAASRKIKMRKGKDGRIHFKNRIKKQFGATARQKNRKLHKLRNEENVEDVAQKKKAKIRLPVKRNDGDTGKDTTQKKAKVLLPKQKIPKEDGVEEYVDENVISEAEGEDANMDCSEFVRSLQSPEKVGADDMPEETTFEGAGEVIGHAEAQFGEEGELIIDELQILEPFNEYTCDIQLGTETIDESLTGGFVFDISDLNQGSL